jgi:Na+-transporting NADH:ubiquinone oxidoreductase subunit NqrD
LILTITDLLGFVPTFRKAYIFPYEEQLSFFSLMIIRNIIIIAALENYSATTILFPAAIAFACTGFVLMVMARRMIIK